MASTLVIAIGNTLLRDEGIGIHILHGLQSQVGDLPDVEFLDLGSGGMSLLHHIGNRKKVIIIDCAFMNEAPATMKRFLPQEVRSGKQLSGFSLHEGDLLKILEIGRQIGEAPDEVVIFGIQPADISPGEELSPLLSAKLQEYIKKVLDKLSK